MAIGHVSCAIRAMIAPGAISKNNAISVPHHSPTGLLWLAGGPGSERRGRVWEAPTTAPRDYYGWPGDLARNGGDVFGRPLPSQVLLLCVALRWLVWHTTSPEYGDYTRHSGTVGGTS